MSKMLKGAFVVAGVLVVAAAVAIVLLTQTSPIGNSQGGGRSGSSTMQFK